jgi:hypothetical protein
MPTDPEQDRESERPSRTSEDRPRKKKVARRPKPPEPLDESKINAPDKQTLAMLSVLGVVSLVLWGLAHAACNYHPPRETRRPRVVKTEEFTRDPKDAAIEVVQRIVKLNYPGALEIASGPLAEELKKEQAGCVTDRAGCDAKRAAAAKAQSLGIVLDRDLGSARVRVVTRGIAGGPKAQLVRVEREGATWKATSRVAEQAGAVLPPAVLPQPPNPHSFMMPDAASPSPSGSAPSPAAPRPRIVVNPKPISPPPPASSAQ